MARQPFVSATPPDFAVLETAIRAIVPDLTLVLGSDPLVVVPVGTIIVERTNAWSPADVDAVQVLIAGAPATTARLTAQYSIDHWSLDLKAAFLVVMDEVNKLRALQTPVPAPYTATQFLAAIRAKAATL